MANRPRANTLLARLPRDVFDRLAPRLHEVDLPLRKILYRAGEPIEQAYFFERGMASLVKHLEDGSMVEVGVTGKEGFVGTPLVLGATSDSVEAMVQIAGSGLRISAADLRAEIARSPVLQTHMLRFAHALHGQISQTAACNQRHQLNERLARWLLMAGERVNQTQIPLSHEFLSVMLGSRRPGITVALGAFREAGILRNTPGKIEILDRDALEAAACECYRVVEQQYARLTAPPG